MIIIHWFKLPNNIRKTSCQGKTHNFRCFHNWIIVFHV